jgi:secretion/DNA translocation related TadE-like protein
VMRRSQVHDERGSVTIVISGVVAVVVFLTLGAADLGTTLIARERAHAAADAAALAAAQELALPSVSTPQQEAGDYAQRNGASLASCACAMGSREAVVGVRLAVGHLFLFPGQHWIEATSRAVVDIPGG